MRLRKVSLSSAPFYTSIAVILSLMLSIGVFWLYNEYRAYRISIGNIQQTYESRYRNRLREKTDNIIDFIGYKRSQTNLITDREIRQKVQTAYTIASHIYSLNKDQKNVGQLRNVVAEILRPIRWNNGRGYYFAGRVTDRVLDLFADDPSVEGTTRLILNGDRGKNLVDEFIRIVREREAGIYRFQPPKGVRSGKSFQEIFFVKYFKPFDWYVGAGMYVDNIQEQIQNDVLARIQKLTFGKGGEIFGFRYDGTIICADNDRLIGRSIQDLVSNTGVPYGRKFLRIGLENEDGGYVGYTEKKGPEHRITHLLGYVKAYKNWHWVIGTSMNMDEMAAAVDREAQTYKRIALRNFFLFISLFAIAVTLLLVLAWSYSLKIRNEIGHFTDFFRKAADAKLKIDDEALVFSEFEELALLANRMVDDMIRQDLLLHRDELRLDTLLQLGTMENHSIQDIYDFTLQRIVQITRSQEGYIALVNDAQTHLTICSQWRCCPDEADFRDNGNFSTLPVEKAGFPGYAVLKRQDLLENELSEKGVASLFPYERRVRRHIDVPIGNGGKIVIVAGVCNDTMRYDNSDIRQMRMVLEGMWLHILKTCSEKELARLERQVIASSQEERNQIGRDLHDDLGSHLSGIEMLSKVLQKKLEIDAPEKAKDLVVIRDLIRHAIDKTQRLAHGLCPVHLIEHGLEVSIEELALEIDNLFQVRCILSFDNDIGQVDNNIATHIYFVVREAVFNAVRHGKPSQIDISFVRSEDFLRVEIIDDGCGIEEIGSKKHGMGFHTMKYRAKAIGASLDIGQRHGGGTVVTLAGEVFR